MDPVEYKQICRTRVISTLQTFCELDELIEYERNVPIAWHRAELHCWWFDDTYRPEILDWIACFSQEEQSAMQNFDSHWRSVEHELPENYQEMLHSPAWQSIMAFAQSTLLVFRDNRLDDK